MRVLPRVDQDYVSTPPYLATFERSHKVSKICPTLDEAMHIMWSVPIKGPGAPIQRQVTDAYETVIFGVNRPKADAVATEEVLAWIGENDVMDTDSLMTLRLEILWDRSEQ